MLSTKAKEVHKQLTLACNSSAATSNSARDSKQQRSSAQVPPRTASRHDLSNSIPRTLAYDEEKAKFPLPCKKANELPRPSLLFNRKLQWKCNLPKN